MVDFIGRDRSPEASELKPKKKHGRNGPKKMYWYKDSTVPYVRTTSLVYLGERQKMDVTGDVPNEGIYVVTINFIS